ncbi:transcriptional regulator, AraC family protein [Mycobacterium xenopi 3993]|nr:transcriptional regulator, AraC family protein [Mycobacterium xenopi 3993]
MVGYRALDVPETVHRGMPSSTLTFIVSLDDGVEAAASAEALPDARPNPLILGGLHLQASHVRQRRGQAGVQLAVHPLASRLLFGVPSAELPVTGYDGGKCSAGTRPNCPSVRPRRGSGRRCSQRSAPSSRMPGDAATV